MNMPEVYDNLQRIDLPPETKKAILKLIDLKVNSDIREVKQEITRLEDRLGLTADKTARYRPSLHLRIIQWVVIAEFAAIILMVFFRLLK
jgi:hypothetical protein